MNQKETTTETEKEIIKQNLARYPRLNRIIPRESCLLYQVAVDQYKGMIPPERFEDIAELSLGGILLYSDHNEEFRKRLERVEGWLERYPEYATPKFGKKILNNFLNFSSELEVYDALKRAGCSPERDVSPEGKTKNLDFRVSPDRRDIYIEVTTPRMSLGTELMYDETPYAGFFNPYRGIEREGYTGPPRWEVIVGSKVINQIHEATSGTNCPVILIINCTYAYPEIMGCGQYTSDTLSAVICYRNGTSEFNLMTGCCLSENEKQFFARLMGPSRAEQLQKIISEISEK